MFASQIKRKRKKKVKHCWMNVHEYIYAFLCSYVYKCTYGYHMLMLDFVCSYVCVKKKKKKKKKRGNQDRETQGRVFYSTRL